MVVSKAFLGVGSMAAQLVVMWVVLLAFLMVHSLGVAPVGQLVVPKERKSVEQKVVQLDH